MAAKFFTGLPLDGPDPECVRGFGEEALAGRDESDTIPRPEGDHSHRTERAQRRSGPVPLTLTVRRMDRPPVSACAEDPLADFSPV